jgi:hypothetical protein
LRIRILENGEGLSTGGITAVMRLKRNCVPHSKTLRTQARPPIRRQVLECARASAAFPSRPRLDASFILHPSSFILSPTAFCKSRRLS